MSNPPYAGIATVKILLRNHQAMDRILDELQFLIEHSGGGVIELQQPMSIAPPIPE